MNDIMRGRLKDIRTVFVAALKLRFNVCEQAFSPFLFFYQFFVKPGGTVSPLKVAEI
jgi:hypothetical protein